MSYFREKRVLVTGAAGTIGKQIIKALLSDDRYKAKTVIGIDHNESELFLLEQECLEYSNAYFHLAELTNRNACHEYLGETDILFHAAALKHVIMCERNPMESVNANIIALENLIGAAKEHNLEKFIFTSSDKAVNPTSVMGTTKLLGERIISATSGTQKTPSTIFASTRFGNVMGSNGSVIPVFYTQIMKGGPVTLTHKDMTRFVMSVETAAQLVLDSALLAQGGEVFITKMPVINIADLAQVMIEELAPKFGKDPSDIEINIVGSKPGEKLYEELMSQEEIERSFELPNYFVITPPFQNIFKNVVYSYGHSSLPKPTKTYISSNELPLSKKELKEYLYTHKLL